MAELSIDSGPATPTLPATTIGGALDEAVDRYGDPEALVSVEQDRRFTYRELSAEVDRVARGLIARGVAKGDRVGIWSPNCYEWVLVQYATARIGAILVTINPAYRTHELAYVLKQSGVFDRSKNFCTRLRGDAGAVFATLNEAFCRFGPGAGHVTLDITISANSPTAV